MKRPEGVGVPAAGKTRAAPVTAAASVNAVRTPQARAGKGARPARPAPAPQPEKQALASSPADAGASRALRAQARERRRYERLEVKRFTRRARRRRTGRFLAFLMVLAVGGLVAIAVFSPLLALRTITVDGTSRLNAGTLEKALDGQLGTPLALLDYGTITRELAPFTLIRSYSTEIVPPDTLVVHVVERTPIGTIQGASSFDLVDPAGVTVETSNTRPAGYPLIHLGSGGVGGPGFASMAQVLLALPPAVLTKVDTITAQTHDDVTLTLAGSNQRVVWGSSDDSDAKARVLADLIALHSGSGPGEYDVSAPGTAVFHHD
ncbi:MAG TPA: FtsQ-type POTRA domain-containing protein [Pseudolysinimonas sp.]|nr:FtsQ-type POTRA domain-containing protein [Pseudolysinimonas sp.]